MKIDSRFILETKIPAMTGTFMELGTGNIILVKSSALVIAPRFAVSVPCELSEDEQLSVLPVEQFKKARSEQKKSDSITVNMKKVQGVKHNKRDVVNLIKAVNGLVTDAKANRDVFKVIGVVPDEIAMIGKIMGVEPGHCLRIFVTKDRKAQLIYRDDDVDETLQKAFGLIAHVKTNKDNESKSTFRWAVKKK